MNGFGQERELRNGELLMNKRVGYGAMKRQKWRLEDAGISPEEIDLIVVSATVTPDKPFPSVSCILQDRLGAKNAGAMDVSAACAGFIYGIVTAKQFIETGAYRYVLVVGVEKLSKITNWDRSEYSRPLWRRSRRRGCRVLFQEGRGILAFELGSDGSGAENTCTGGKRSSIDEWKGSF